MTIDIKDLNIPHLLLRHYRKYKLSEKEVIVILSILNISSDSKKLITHEDIGNYLSFTKEESDEILTSLTNKKIISYSKDEKDNYITSLDPLIEKLQADFIKDLTLKINHSKSKTQKDTNSLYSYLSKLIGRTLSPKEVDRISNWIQEGYSIDDIKEASEHLKAKSNSLSIPALDKYLYNRDKKKETGVASELENDPKVRELLAKKWLPEDDD